jgi:carbonic anhydrase
LEEISDLVRRVQERSAEFTANPEKPIQLDGLLTDPNKANLPSTLQRFYRYNGSLTTPPCTEGITWLLMADPNVIGLEQVSHSI